MSEKKKKDFPANQSDIHTIVDLPLEAVIEHLMGLSKHYDVQLEKQSSDEVSFLIKNKQLKGKIYVEADGKIRRWNGTLTRLDAAIGVVIIQRNSFLQNLERFNWGLVCFVGYLILLFLTLPFARFNLYYSPLFHIMGVIPGVWSIIFLIGRMLLILFVDINTRSYGRGLSPQYVKPASTIIQNLMDELSVKLKEKATSLEFDGTEDNLTMLLQEEKHKNFRLGADGEMNTP